MRRSVRAAPWLGLPIVVLCLLGAAPCAGQDATVPDRAGALRASLAAQAERPALAALDCAAYVADLETGQELFALQPDAPLIPASNMKLLTTAAAMSVLGPDWRFRTFVGILGDDLVVVGGGDPNLSGRFYEGLITEAFRQWAAALKARRVTEVKGDLVFDDSLFDAQWVNPNWEAADLGEWFAAPVGALACNDSCLDVYVRPGPAAGQPGVVRIEPATAYVTLRPSVVTHTRGASATSVSLDPRSRVLTVSGVVTLKSGESRIYRAVDDPGMFAATVIRETLERQGVRVAGRVVRRRVWTDDWRLPKALRVQVVHTSSLAQTVDVANTRSQNLYAECILKAVGAFAGSGDATRPSRQGSWASAREAALGAIRKLGVKAIGTVLDDGSGLSLANRVSARTLAEVLLAMGQGPQRAVWLDSMAVAGDEEGTLRKVSDGRLQDRLFAKSGYMGQARALSGYVKTDSGRVLVFSLLANGRGGGPMDHGPARTWFHDVCVALAGY